MADGVKERVGEVLEQAKGAVRKGGPPVATDVEGRVAVVREALRHFGDGDFDAFLDSMDDDVRWEAPDGGNFPGGGALNGRGEIEERFLGDVHRSYATFGFAPETYLESDDRDWVVVIGEFKGEGVKGGEPVSEPGVQLWEFENGKVAAVRLFVDSAVFPSVVSEEDEQQEEEEDETSAKESEGAADEDAGEARSESGEHEDEDEEGDEKEQHRDDG